MKVLQIVGARPQFIKAAMLSRELRSTNGVKELILHTGQHYDYNMSEVFFQEMEIPKPDYNLEVNNLGHGAMTGQMLEGIEKVLLQETPDWVVVHGDTNSTLAGALAASKLHIKVAHVEAGLRSYNKDMPEEVNRILTDHISDLLLVPTLAGVENLRREGITGSKVQETGDIMYDSCLFYSARADQKSNIVTQMELDRYALCTVHRAENTDDIAHLTGLVNPGLILQPQQSNGFQYSQGAKAINICRILGGFETHSHMRHRPHVIYFIRLNFLNDSNDVG